MDLPSPSTIQYSHSSSKRLPSSTTNALHIILLNIRFKLHKSSLSAVPDQYHFSWMVEGNTYQHISPLSLTLQHRVFITHLLQMQKDPHSYLSDFGIICNQLSVKSTARTCKCFMVKLQLHQYKFKT